MVTIPASAVQGYQALLEQLRTASLTDLNKLLVSLGDAPTTDKKRALEELLPELGNQYAGSAAAVAAAFFEEVAQLQGIRAPVVKTVETIPDESWESLVGFSVGRSLAEQAGNAAFFLALSGGMTRRVTQAAGDTIIASGLASGVAGYQRVARPGCCAFCAMLAGRGAEYLTAESARFVTGRGQDESVSYLRDAAGNIVRDASGNPRRRRGGQARGVQTRGTRPPGATFHDHCQCVVVPVHEGNRLEMDAAAEAHRDVYADAYNAVSGDLKPRTTRVNGRARTVWVDSTGATVTAKDRTNRIINHMRRNLPAA